MARFGHFDCHDLLIITTDFEALISNTFFSSKTSDMAHEPVVGTGCEVDDGLRPERLAGKQLCLDRERERQLARTRKGEMMSSLVKIYLRSIEEHKCATGGCKYETDTVNHSCITDDDACTRVARSACLLLHRRFC
jgi:hypothetical protein